MLLQDKIVLITGGATGIGEATAQVVAAEGASVVVADMNADEGRATVAAIVSAGGQAHFVETDVTSSASVAAVVEFADSQFGRLDVLISCAGVYASPNVRVDDYEEAVWDKLLNVNLKGSFLCAHHVVPLMEKGGGGVILFMGSTAGTRVPSGSVAYGASKGGIQGLAYTLEAQLKPAGIRVNVICPDQIATPLKLQAIRDIAVQEGITEQEAMAEWEPKLGHPDGVAKVLALLASDAAAYVTGMIYTR
jgi:NAD(P)-dependent dehydrogenase (short-subunit alcohol dehydrogenase family)